jgi:voltage-gated potassium channel
MTVPMVENPPVQPTGQRRALRHLRVALLALAIVVLGGSLGYWALGASPLDAVYDTVALITTVGFRESTPPAGTEKVFTIFLILAGVGTALYSLGVLIEVLLEGQLAAIFGRRRMERRIAAMAGHVIVCGWGRVGRVVADHLATRKMDFVVVDMDSERVGGVPFPCILGDATDDTVLREAGIDRARSLVTVMSNDAANLYVTLSGRSLNPALFIVGRARVAESEEKIRRAGADRVINPQAIGGARIAALLFQPHVSEFLDVVTHDAGLEFRLEEVRLPQGSALSGTSLGDSHIRARTGALVLALRRSDGSFATNPPPDTVITADQVLIAIGTQAQLDQLSEMVRA